MKRILSSLIFLSLVGSTVSLAAIPVTRYDAYVVEVPQLYASQGGYWGLLIGGNFLSPTNMHPSIVGDNFNPNTQLYFSGQALPGTKVSYQGGEYVGFSTGYRIYGFRFEAELDYRHNKFSKVNNLFNINRSGTTAAPAENFPPTIFNAPVEKQGDLILLSFMGNIIYDWYWTSGWMVSFGGGIGYTIGFYDAELKEVYDSFGTEVTPYIDFSGTVHGPAAQIILGVAYRWNPCLETALTYKCFGRSGSSYDVTDRFVNNFAIEFRPKYLTNTISLEFRFT